MQWLYFILTVCLFAEAGHVLHERRDTAPRGPWRRAGRVEPDAIIPVRIGLKQTNLDLGAERLTAVSHPESIEYGKHLSEQEIHELFAPSEHTVDSVREWLIASGINETVIAHSDNKGWIAADVPARVAEELFRSEIYEHENPKTGHVRLGCQQYHVPADLAEHIDYVTPGVKMSAVVRKRDVKRSDVRGHDNFQGRGDLRGHGEDRGHGDDRSRKDDWKHPSWHHHDPHKEPHWPNEHHFPHDWPGRLPKDVKHCGGNITPPCLRYLYKLPFPHINDSVNAVGLFEQGDYFAQSDIDMYFDKFAPYVPSEYSPKVVSVDGGEAPVPADDPNNGGEAVIDVDIVTALVYPQSVVVYQVDDINYGPAEFAQDNLFNTFLDAVDGSYCKYSAYGITGDSPNIDPVYPDPAPDGYKGQRQCGVYKLTRVVSISYGEDETDLPVNYVRRQCNEFMKLGLQGHTILAASGDFGVGGLPGVASESGCLGLDEKVFNPDYPNGCPYITSVGGTMVGSDHTVSEPETALQISRFRPGRPEAYKFFSSSGGFSNYFPIADYQKEAVSEWFRKHDPGYPTYIANADASNIGANGGIYNRAGRAGPDISANGAFVPLFLNGTQITFYGTSISSPIVAGVITLINQQRTKAGKGPVGFINPALYHNPWMLNDITNGTNGNCGSRGFEAVRGWDPVTGLGTPNYPKMLEYFLRLP